MAEPFVVVSVAEMRALEAAAMAAGTPERVLQERAGLAVADAVEALPGWPALTERPARPTIHGAPVIPPASRPSLPHAGERERGIPHPSPLPAGEGARLPLPLGEGWGEGRPLHLAGEGRPPHLRGEGRPPLSRPRVVVLVGAGNNGRDGVVAGRRLAARGCTVELWLGARHGLSEGEQRDLAAEGLIFGAFVGAEGLAALRASLRGAQVVVDGLLGVGSRGPMRPDLEGVAVVLAEVCQADRRPWVVAVDVPSGVDADDGSVPGAAIQADLTVTFGAVKAGLLRFPAASYVGRLLPRPIGLPAGSSAAHPVHLLDGRTVAPLVPARALDAHKYRFGRVLVLAGSEQFVGAACLGAEAAARAGAGLVGVVSTESVKRVLAARLPEATYPLTIDSLEEHPEEAADRVAALLPEQSALLLGPGVGRSAGTDRFIRRLLPANAAHDRPTPAVIDADALTLLAGWDSWWEWIGPGNVLTPHAGEMARLLGPDTVEGEAPWDTARRAAARWRQVVVLKGPFTTVAEPGGRAWVYGEANPALATAGTGDVLAGLCAGLVSQGLAGLDAARLAVVAHALAASRLIDERGWRTLLASDLSLTIPAILSALGGSPRASAW